jgi:hypothetical protein
MMGRRDGPGVTRRERDGREGGGGPLDGRGGLDKAICYTYVKEVSMHPSFQKGHEIGYDLKRKVPEMSYSLLMDIISRNLAVGDHYVLLALGVYVGYTSAGGIVYWGYKES